MRSPRSLGAWGLRWCLAAAVSVPFLAPVAVAQQPLPAAGRTASVTGIVAAADGDRRPISRATVTLSRADVVPLVSITDDRGQFVFQSVPAGTFTLAASKSAFRSTETVPVTVALGEQLTGISLTLTKGAVISGRVSDEYGRPLSNAPVLVLEFRIFNGARTLWSLGEQAVTDGRGEYRAYGLPAGEYLVSAYAPGSYSHFPGRPEGPMPGIGGASESLRLVTDAEVQWAQQQLLVARNGTAVGGLPPAPTPSVGGTAGYTTTFHPGTKDPTSAATVSVALGEERAGVDITMRRLATSRIAGRVVGADAQPVPNAQVMVSGTGWVEGRRTAADGTFAVADLLGGEVTIQVTSPGTGLSTTTTVSLAGQDVTGLVIRLSN